MMLVVPSVQQLTHGDRAFPVAALHPNHFILHLLSATTEDTSV